MQLTESQEKIMAAIESYHNKTEGKCGLSFVNLILETGYGFEEIKPMLTELHKNKMFHVRKGINDKLFFYGSKKK